MAAAALPARGRWCRRPLAAALGLGAVAAMAQPAPVGDARWVNGSGVNLRAAPSLAAPVLARLKLNTPVRLLAAAGAEGTAPGFCRIALATAEPAGGPPGAEAATDPVVGHVACQYLAAAPVELARMAAARLGDGRPNPDHDPARRFWLAPSQDGLLAYAEHLANLRFGHDRTSTPAEPRPPDAELERMKAHLALGIRPAGPPAPPAWVALKAGAEAAVLAPAAAGPLAAADEVPGPLQALARQLSQSLGLDQPLHDASRRAGAARLVHLVRAIELPAVRPSLWTQGAELASPNAGIEQVAGQFGGVVRYLNHPRRDVNPAATVNRGTWDIGSVSRLLARPVTRLDLYRDGRLAATPTRLQTTETLWGDVDPPMCEGFEPGYAFGDSDPAIWRGYRLGDGNPSGVPVARGKLLHVYLARPPTGARAAVTVQRLRLDRAATGFVQATQLHLDLDHDGVPDLAVWEGVGRGPGHMDNPTQTDDAWHRIFFANVGGQWQVLGHDSFRYGCGC